MVEVCIIGAGLAGAMAAALLSKLKDGQGQKYKVYIYEKREDPRQQELTSAEVLTEAFGSSTSSTKRSINLALSHRGQVALRELGLLEEVMLTAIPMPERVIHSRDGSIARQAYGKEGESLYSVGRQMLNITLLNYLSDKPNIILRFNHSLSSVSADGRVVELIASNGSKVSHEVDLVIGADGAYSRTRDLMLRQSRVDFSRSYIRHGYKELSIPPSRDEKTGALRYALNNPNGLHIWPRESFMLIALPNPDLSFTATLFAPYEGPDGFDSVDKTSALDIEGYFSEYFPDVGKIMPNLVQDFRENPVGSLVTIRVNPWYMGRCVLIGDAAHAVVPFYGQGMNAAFEDAFRLYEKLNGSEDIDRSISAFADKRRLATDSLADLCLEHYNDMALNTASTWYLLGKKLEVAINYVLPTHFVPLYSMVAFSTTPYNEAVRIVEERESTMKNVLAVTATVSGAVVLATILMRYVSVQSKN